MAGTIALGARRSALGPSLAAVAGAFVFAGRTRADSGSDRAETRGRTAEGRAPARAAFAVQVRAFADAANARRLRDSLAGEGFGATVRDTVVDGAPRHRVLVAPSTSEALARRIAAAFARGATVVRVLVAGDAAGDDVTVVEASSLGMASRVRWMVSPSGYALLVAHDPAAVEAEPVADAVALADGHDDGVLLLRDVWDVAPDARWDRLAVSWAYVLQGREAPEIPRARWAEFVRALPAPVRRAAGDVPDAAAARASASAFSVSGMSVAYGLGAVQLLPADAPRGGVRSVGRESPPDARVLRLDGWKVRWMRDGALAVGTGSSGAQEFHPPARWVRVDTVRGDSLSTADTTMLARAPWTLGPTIDHGQVIDMPPAGELPIARGRVTSRGGWVRVERDGRARVVGPGQALAAVANGRFVLAIAPPVPARNSHPGQVVIYRVGR